MIILEVAFVLFNLAVPYWIWVAKSSGTPPAGLRKTLHELQVAAGGFTPCTDREVVDALDDLCQKSRAKLEVANSTALERAADGVVFSCEAQRDQFKIRWFPEPNTAGELKCRSGRPSATALAPVIVVNLKGQLRRIEVNGPGGERLAVPLTECRLKLKRAAGLNENAKREDFLRMVGGAPMALSACLNFDPQRDWEKWRKRFAD